MLVGWPSTRPSLVAASAETGVCSVVVCALHILGDDIVEIFADLWLRPRNKQKRGRRFNAIIARVSISFKNVLKV